MSTITQMISALSTPPSRTDPANFDDRADQFLGELPDRMTEANAQAEQMNTVAGEVNDHRSAAESASAAAVAAAAISAWEAGTPYAVGDTKYGSDGHSYRAIQPSTGVDPVTDGGLYWTCLTGRRPAVDNEFLNGEFEVWQMGTDSTVTGSPSLPVADMWKVATRGGVTDEVVHVSRQEAGDVMATDTPYCIQVAISETVDDGYAHLVQRREDCYRLSGSWAALSFKARCLDGPRSVSFELYRQSSSIATTEVMDLGIGATSFDITTEWQEFSHVFYVPPVTKKPSDRNDSVIAGCFYLTCTDATEADWAFGDIGARSSHIGPQSGTFQFARCNLVQGVVPLPIVPLRREKILEKCRRYCAKSYPEDTPPGTPEVNENQVHFLPEPSGAPYIAGYLPWPCEMRAKPVVTIYRPSTGEQGYVETGSERSPVAVDITEHGANALCLLICPGGTTLASERYQFHYLATSYI
jgi:hypothetical protein